MALQSTDIDAKLEELAGKIRSIRASALGVVSETNRASSTLSQLSTDYSELIAAVNDLSGSSNPVDQLQMAKLAKITAEAGSLSTSIAAVKNAIDNLGI